jgi:molybdate transport repressor ModE-like protein
MQEPHRLWSIDLRQLAALEAVAEAGTVTGAAAQLGYSQSAVSQQLAALERLVGHQLVRRTPGARSASLTEAGRRLLAHASDIRGSLVAAGADLEAVAAGRRGVVRLGAAPSLAAALLPAAAGLLRRRAPELELRVDESHRTADLLEGLRHGRADLVLAPLYGTTPGVQAHELGRDRIVLLVAAADRLARLRRPVEPRDVAGRDVIAKDCGSATQDALDAALDRAGVRVTTRLRATDGRTVRDLVAAGHGVAFLPRLMVPEDDASTRALVVADWLPARRLALHRPLDWRPPALAAVVDEAIRDAASRVLAAA